MKPIVLRLIQTATDGTTEIVDGTSEVACMIAAFFAVTPTFVVYNAKFDIHFIMRINGLAVSIVRNGENQLPYARGADFPFQSAEGTPQVIASANQAAALNQAADWVSTQIRQHE
jgi:hypothetical protein